MKREKEEEEEQIAEGKVQGAERTENGERRNRKDLI